MKKPLPIPAWAVFLMMFNFQIAVMLEVMEASQRLGGLNLENPWEWVVLTIVFALVTLLVVFAIVKESLLLLIPAFILDFGDLIYDFVSQNLYFYPQLFLFVSFWILPTIIFVNMRSKSANTPGTIL